MIRVVVWLVAFPFYAVFATVGYLGFGRDVSGDVLTEWIGDGEMAVGADRRRRRERAQVPAHGVRAAGHRRRRGGRRVRARRRKPGPGARCPTRATTRAFDGEPPCVREARRRRPTRLAGRRRDARRVTRSRAETALRTRKRTAHRRSFARRRCLPRTRPSRRARCCCGDFRWCSTSSARRAARPWRSSSRVGAVAVLARKSDERRRGRRRAGGFAAPVQSVGGDARRREGVAASACGVAAVATEIV